MELQGNIEGVTWGIVGLSSLPRRDSSHSHFQSLALILTDSHSVTPRLWLRSVFNVSRPDHKTFG